MKARGYITIFIAIHSITLPYTYYISALSNSQHKNSNTGTPTIPYYSSKANKLSTVDFDVLRDGWGIPAPLLYQSDDNLTTNRDNYYFYEPLEAVFSPDRMSSSDSSEIPIHLGGGAISYFSSVDITALKASIQELSRYYNNKPPDREEEKRKAEAAEAKAKKSGKPVPASRDNTDPYSLAYTYYNRNTLMMYLADQDELTDSKNPYLVHGFRRCYGASKKKETDPLMNELSKSSLINLSTTYMRLKSDQPSGYLESKSMFFYDERSWYEYCSKSTLNLYLTSFFVPPPSKNSANADKNPYFNSVEIQKLNELSNQFLAQSGDSPLKDKNLHFYRLILAAQNLETALCRYENDPLLNYQLALTYSHLLSMIESQSSEPDFMFGLLKDNYIGEAIKTNTLEKSLDLLESAIVEMEDKRDSLSSVFDSGKALSDYDNRLYFSLLKELFLVQLQFGVRSPSFSNDHLLESLLELVPEPASNPYYQPKQEENRAFDLFIQLYQLDLETKDSETSRNQKRRQFSQEIADSELKTKIFSEYAHTHISALLKQLNSLPSILKRLQFVRGYESQADFMQLAKAADVRLTQGLHILERPILALSGLPFSQFFFFAHVLISSLSTLFYGFMIIRWTRNTFKNNYK